MLQVSKILGNKNILLASRELKLWILEDIFNNHCSHGLLRVRLRQNLLTTTHLHIDRIKRHRSGGQQGSESKHPTQNNRLKKTQIQKQDHMDEKKRKTTQNKKYRYN